MEGSKPPVQSQLHAARRIEQHFLQRDRHRPQAREHFAASEHLAALLLVPATGLRRSGGVDEARPPPTTPSHDPDERGERFRPPRSPPPFLAPPAHGPL